MKVLFVLAVIVSAVGFLVISATGGASAAGTGVCPENPSPPDAADPSIIVEAPAEGARVTSPVTVSGRARVFEAVVSITIFDAAGSPLVETFTMASEAGPALAPFSAQVPFTVSQEQKGCIRVFESSAQDGRPVNVVQVEVTLAPPGVSPPSTGDAGLGNREGADNLTLYAVGATMLLGATALALRRRMWS